MIHKIQNPKRFAIFSYDGALTDNRLKEAEFMIIIRLLSKPRNWRPNTKAIAKECNMHKNTVYRAFNRLIKLGYIQRSQRKVKGKFTKYEYEIHEKPLHRNSETVIEANAASQLSASDEAGKQNMEGIISIEDNKNDPKKTYLFKGHNKQSCNEELSENTLKIIEVFKAYFRQVPTGLPLWDKYFIEKDVTPEDAEKAFGFIAKYRNKNDWRTPALADVIRALEMTGKFNFKSL